jgi:hypothetical protein
MVGGGRIRRKAEAGEGSKDLGWPTFFVYFRKLDMGLPFGRFGTPE